MLLYLRNPRAKPFLIEGFFIPASTEADGNLKSLFIFQILGVLRHHLHDLHHIFYQTLIYLSSGRIPVVSQDHDYEVLMKAMAY